MCSVKVCLLIVLAVSVHRKRNRKRQIDCKQSDMIEIPDAENISVCERLLGGCINNGDW